MRHSWMTMLRDGRRTHSRRSRVSLITAVLLAMCVDNSDLQNPCQTTPRPDGCGFNCECESTNNGASTCTCPAGWFGEKCVQTKTFLATPYNWTINSGAITGTHVGSVFLLISKQFTLKKITTNGGSPVVVGDVTEYPGDGFFVVHTADVSLTQAGIPANKTYQGKITAVLVNESSPEIGQDIYEKVQFSLGVTESADSSPSAPNFTRLSSVPNIVSTGTNKSISLDSGTSIRLDSDWPQRERPPFSTNDVYATVYRSEGSIRYLQQLFLLDYLLSQIIKRSDQAGACNPQKWMIPKPKNGCPSEHLEELTLSFVTEVDVLDTSHLSGNATHLHVCAQPWDEAQLITGLGPSCVFSTTENCSHLFKHRSSNPIFQTGHDFNVSVCCSEGTKFRSNSFPKGRPFYLLPYPREPCEEVDSWFSVLPEKFPMPNVFCHNRNHSAADVLRCNNNNNTPFLLFCYFEPSYDTIIYIAVSVTSGLVALACLCACCGRHRWRIRQLQREVLQLRAVASTSSTSDLITATEPSDKEGKLTTQEDKKQSSPLDLGTTLKLILDPESKLKIYGLLIHPDKLEIMEKVGKGAFGTVYGGKYRPDDNPLNIREVAIKTLKDSCVYPEVSAFMEEAIVMADFNHVNVLKIIGVCVKPETEIPMIVLPFMRHGDLHRYCRQFRYDDALKGQAPDLCQLLSFSLHIARGMEYLSGSKFIHRDLAARNCMLDGNMVVKVADFGLARDVYSNSYYRQDQNKLLPIKWMSLESLQDRVFTSYTDVWSYGVTVWEIFTLGKVPYPDLENAQVLPQLEAGLRLTKPTTSPDTVYELMQKCWLENPKERPNFTDICQAVEEILSGYTEYLDLDGKPDKAVPNDTCGPDVVLSPLELLEQEKKTLYADYRDVTLFPKEL